MTLFVVRMRPPGCNGHGKYIASHGLGPVESPEFARKWSCVADAELWVVEHALVYWPHGDLAVVEYPIRAPAGDPACRCPSCHQDRGSP